MTRKFGLALAMSAALGATALIGTTYAMPVGPAATSAAALNPIEKTQLFIFGGRHYCFYVDGWNGPGWYWCGYAHRHGFGWGGGEGFHGWHRGGVHPGPHGHPGPHPHPHHH